MKSSIFLAFVLLNSFLLLFSNTSCVFESNSGQPGKKTGISKAGSLPQIPPEVMKHGEEVYNSFCLACHQKDGSGNPGMYPPLNETKTVNGNKEKLIEIVLEGLSGEIEVKGRMYDQVMVPHNFLTDQQIAVVLTYIRNSFGNSAPRITKKEVAEVRGEK